MQVPRLSIVMPAYNEEANIKAAILGAIQAGRRFAEAYEVVVVDDGSTDRTAEFVEEASAEARMAKHPRNVGYGGALRTCLAEARYDLILFVDADNQFELGEIGRLLKAIENADVAVGFRSERRDPATRRVAAAAWNQMIRLLFDVPVRDVDCGFKLFRRQALDGIHLRSRGAMISTELMVRLGLAGRVVVEVEVSHRPRDGGRASGLRPRVIARAFGELWRLFPELSRWSRKRPRMQTSRSVRDTTATRNPASPEPRH